MGLGADIVEIKRFTGKKGASLARSFLTRQEWGFCLKKDASPEWWAALWSAREAVYKATSGLINILPLSWEMEPLPGRRWRATPRKYGMEWREFVKDHLLEVAMVTCESHAVAVAVVTNRAFSGGLKRIGREREK